MKRIVLCVSAVALASSLGTPWSSSQALAAESAPAPKATNASCVVTKAEAEAILGEPLDDLTSPLEHSCDYGHKPNRPHLFMTELRTNESKSSFESETQNAAKAIGAKLKPAAGYGEQAVWIGTSQIVVLQHGKAFSVRLDTKVAPAKLDAFLRKALSRM
jgi:hypothetical protein